MNMQQLMAQAQRVQKDIEKKKEEINNTEFSGSSELVDVVFMGDRTMKKITIKEDNIDKEMLEDMMLIAVNDALKKIDKAFADKMGAYGNAGGLF